MGYPKTPQSTSNVNWHDVWIGHNARIMPSARRVGRSGGPADSHVVPQYAAVAGIAARVSNLRIWEDVIAKIEESRWWRWRWWWGL